MSIYDNAFLQEGDLIEVEFPENVKGKFGTHCNYVAEVRSDPMWLVDLVIWYGGEKVWVTDSQYDIQLEDKEIREFRDRIVKIYRKINADNYVCVWRKG